jgi:hypothetical protein
MNRRCSSILLLGCAMGLALGVWALFRLRFEVGDVYPEYSSLRADPLGTMALYESLEKLPGRTVRRDYSSENQLPEGAAGTYLHLAANRQSWQWLPPELIGQVQRFTARGGRLVLTFLPEEVPLRVVTGARTSVPRPPTAKGTNAPATKTQKKMAKETPLAGTVSLKDKLGVDIRVLPGTNELPLLAELTSDLDLPERLAWHSQLCFQNLDPAWKVVYSHGTNAVVIERKLGAGSIVMCSDSYFLSNEALARERHPDLLAWVIGPAQVTWFDEAHLGVMESSGVATLMRQYRLQWPVAALVFLALLFVWKNSSPLGGRPDVTESPDSVEGKEAGAGFVNLLRRNIPKRELVKVCFEEWTKSLGLHGRHTLSRVDAAQAVIEQDVQRARVDHDPVRVYNEICRALKARERR